MRRWVILAALLVGEASVALTPAAAQPFGFLFGSPSRPTRSSRRQRPRPPPVPLPVPRPHFAEDPPAAAAKAAPPGPAKVTPDLVKPNLATSDPSVRAETAQPETPASGSPPVPPAKPADLGGAPAPAAPAVEPAEPVASPQAPVSQAPAPTAPARPDGGPPLTVPVTAQPPLTPLPPPKPAEIGPPSTTPAIAASGATNATSPRQPDEDAACPARLKTRLVAAEPVAIGPQPDDRCRVAQPMRLTGMLLPEGESVTFPDRPIIACATVDTFASYVGDLLSPLAKGTFGAKVAAVWTGPGLECRSRDHILGAKLSAHGQGLAIDIAQLKLADGHAIAVGEPKTAPEVAFETAARAGACGYFHTVLGPGSDSYHRTHWHFDLEIRGAKGDTKYCK